MEKKIYYVLGELSEKKYLITATLIFVKETDKSYKVLDSSGCMCMRSILPKDVVKNSVVTDKGLYNRFDNVRYEAYCLPENVESVMDFIQHKIDNYHLDSVKIFEKVKKSFNECAKVIVKPQSIKKIKTGE